MKNPTILLFVVAAFTAVGCAATTHGQLSASLGPNEEAMTVSHTSSSSRRSADTADTSTVAVMEPMGMRAERGIPTPQPARDPSGFSGPVPQPPIPSPSGHAGYTDPRARW